MNYDEKLEALNAHHRLAALYQQLHDVRDRVFELLDELDVVEILRAQVPTRQLWLLDRLECALRRIDSLDESIAGAEYDVELETEDGDPEATSTITTVPLHADTTL